MGTFVYQLEDKRQKKLARNTKLGTTKVRECELPFSFSGIMPIDINDLCEGWLELESDPGKLSHSMFT